MKHRAAGGVAFELVALVAMLALFVWCAFAYTREARADDLVCGWIDGQSIECTAALVTGPNPVLLNLERPLFADSFER